MDSFAWELLMFLDQILDWNSYMEKIMALPSFASDYSIWFMECSISDCGGLARSVGIEAK